ncbi:MAG: DinB family protein [Acidimicrobiales bacterium]
MSIDDLAREYETATEEFLAAVASVDPSLYDHHVEGGWSTRQVVHHVADSETQSYARLRRLVAEPPGTVIQGYDEALWAASPLLGYQELPIEHSLAVFAAVRQSSLDILRRLSEGDLEREGVHTESGPYSVRTWIDTYTRHPREHAAQLREAAHSKG